MKIRTIFLCLMLAACSRQEQALKNQAKSSNKINDESQEKLILSHLRKHEFFFNQLSIGFGNLFDADESNSDDEVSMYNEVIVIDTKSKKTYSFRLEEKNGEYKSIKKNNNSVEIIHFLSKFSLNNEFAKEHMADKIKLFYYDYDEYGHSTEQKTQFMSKKQLLKNEIDMYFDFRSISYFQNEEKRNPFIFLFYNPSLFNSTSNGFVLNQALEGQLNKLKFKKVNSTFLLTEFLEGPSC